MKYAMKKMLAIIIAVMLALPGMLPAVAEDYPPEGEPADVVILDEFDGDEDAGEVSGDIPFEDMLAETYRGGYIEEDDPAGDGEQEPPQDAPAAATVYLITEDYALIDTLEVVDGEALARPQDPAAPEGMAFEAWYDADGNRLFADGDAEVVRLDGATEITFFARFVEAPEEPSPLGEGGASAPEEVASPSSPADDETKEETTSPDTADAVSPSPEGEGLEDASPTTPGELSPGASAEAGEGGASAPEEVVPPTSPADDETKEETTSPDTADAVSPSPEGEGLEDASPTTPGEPSPGASAEAGEGGASAPDEVVPTDELTDEELAALADPDADSDADPDADAELVDGEEESPDADRTGAAGEGAEADPDYPAFEQSENVDGVVVTVKAEPGVFPAGALLSVESVPVYQQRQADAAVDEVRDENQNVAVSYTFDIKVIDPETGEEYQPNQGQTVSVSFALAEVADENLETSVYHITEDEDTGDLTAQALDTEVSGDTASAETDGFSFYTVEFTYNDLEYVLPGDTSVAMSEILTALGLTGEVTAVGISDTNLFSASNETGEWIVTAHQAFDTTEWMKVTINGVVYEITVTDDASYSATFKYNGKTYSAGSLTGTASIPLTDILAGLEITGTVTAASVSEGQGMTVTTNELTLTQAFGSGWLKVTANGTEYQIIVTSSPNSISVVLYGTLFFDKNGGSGIMDGQSVREYTNTILPNCAFTPPDGYAFDQWEINGAMYDAGETYFFGQTITAKAIWKLREGVNDISASYESSNGDVVITPTKAAQGETVTVTVQPIAGKAIDSITYSYGSTIDQALSGGEGGVYSFSMPGEDTTVSVTFKDVATTPIPYVDGNGSNQECTTYSYVRSTVTTWSGWVVASQNLTLDSRVIVSGTVNLILMDDKTLTVTNGIQVSEGSTLNIYSQSGNTGKLIAGNKQNSYAAGIGGNKDSYNAGTITINGGQITATGGQKSAGIGGSSDSYPYLGNAGNITIRGNANVAATGGAYSSGIGCGSGGIGGSITIDGNATVQARAIEGYSGSGAAIGSGRGGYVNSITISGGTVIATGANMGSAIGNGNSNSGRDGGTISITGGNVTATATGSSGAGIGGLCASITIGGNAVVHASGANNGAGIGGYYQKAVGNITIEGNANVTATGGASGAGIGTGSEATGEAVITIKGGTVNASMSASNGAAAIGSGNKAKGKTTVSISGGQVTASGSTIYGVGIGGGNTGAAGEEVIVNITGGTVRASGRTGIGTANASNAKLTVNISGGTVIASGAINSGNKGAAIGQGNNSNSVTEINITGGVVKTLGAGSGIGAGANSKQTPTITLSYTDATKDGIEITAIDYNGTVTLQNDFIYQDTKTDVSTPITGNKTIVCKSSTAHTHSFTYTVNDKTITATCGENGCPLTNSQATLTIGVPDGKTSMVYDGTAKAAVLTGNTDLLIVDVVYKKDNAILPSAPSDVGSYTASITLGAATATVSYEITKKTVTFASITAKDKEYDGTTKASCLIGTGLNGAISGDNVYAYVYTGNATFEDANVGVNKKVTFSNWRIEGTAKGNYKLIQPEPQYRAITPRVITITAKNQTVAQGGTVVSTPEQVEVTSGPLVEGHSISEITLTGDTSSVTTNGTITPSAVKIVDSSNIDVTANYAVNYTAGTLTVTEAPAHTHSFTYTAGTGETANTVTATCIAGCPNGYNTTGITLTLNAPTSLTYNGTAKEASISGYPASAPTGLAAGPTTITYYASTGAGSTATSGEALTGAPSAVGDYVAQMTWGEQTASVAFSISKAPLTVTAKPKTITYGDTPANDGVTYSGFVNSETSTVLNGMLDYDYSYTQYGDVGSSYTITPKGLTSTNYSITFAPGTLTVEKKEVGLEWSTTPLTFNGEAQAPTATATGLVNNDAISVTVTVDGEHINAGDNYTATASGLTGSKARNYKLPTTGLTQTFSIEKATARTIADVTQSVFYTSTSVSASVAGKMPSDAGTLTYAKSSNDAISKVTSWSVNETTGAVEATLSGGASGDTITLPVTIRSTNYADSTVNVVVTLTNKTDAGVTIDNQTVTYGDTGVVLSGTVTNAGTGGAWTWSSGDTTVAEINANTGTVTIKKAGSASITAKYESDTTIGEKTITLTVNPKAVTIKADAKSKTYGDSDPALTAQVTGAVNGEKLNYTLSRAAGENVGEYAISVTLGSNPNYTVTATGATLTVGKKTVTIKADAKSKTYGDSDPALTAQVTGAVNGDALNYTLSRAAGEDVGEYAISMTPGNNPNYTVTATGATLTIAPKAVAAATVVLSETEYTADGTAKEPGVTVKDGDTVIPATEYTVSYSDNVQPGTARVTITDEAGGNYVVSGSATFTIKAAPKPEPEPQKLARFFAKLKAKGKTSLVVSWDKVKGAKGYDVFFSPCNDDEEKYTPKLIKSVKGNKTFSYTKTGLKRGETYKAYVMAYKRVNGKKVYIAQTPTVHAYVHGRNNYHSNASKIVLTSKSSVTLKKGKTSKIRASVRVRYTGRHLITHAAKLRYYSSNPKVAKVTAKGKIVAVKKGKCTVTLLTPDGVKKTVKVRVK